MALASPAGQTGLEPAHASTQSTWPARHSEYFLFFFRFWGFFWQEKKENPSNFQDFFSLHFLAPVSFKLQVLPLYATSMTFFSSQMEGKNVGGITENSPRILFFCRQILKFFLLLFSKIIYRFSS